MSIFRITFTFSLNLFSARTREIDASASNSSRTKLHAESRGVYSVIYGMQIILPHQLPSSYDVRVYDFEGGCTGYHLCAICTAQNSIVDRPTK